MTQQAELHQKIDTLPPEYFGEVIDFVVYLQQKKPISVTPLTQKSKTSTSLLSLRGSCKGLDTMEAYFERKRADKALEDKGVN